jgi:hypothetical protein
LVMKDYMKVFMNEGGDPYTILLELLTRWLYNTLIYKLRLS